MLANAGHAVVLLGNGARGGALAGLGVIGYWLLTAIAGRTFALVVSLGWVLVLAPVVACSLSRAIRIRLSGEPYDIEHALDAAIASMWFPRNPRFWFALLLPVVLLVLAAIYALPLTMLLWGLTWAVGYPGRELTGPSLWALRGLAFVCALGTVRWLWKHL